MLSWSFWNSLINNHAHDSKWGTSQPFVFNVLVDCWLGFWIFDEWWQLCFDLVVSQMQPSTILQLLSLEEPWTLILDDALANSFVAPVTEDIKDDLQLACKFWFLIKLLYIFVCALFFNKLYTYMIRLSRPVQDTSSITNIIWVEQVLYEFVSLIIESNFVFTNGLFNNWNWNKPDLSLTSLNSSRLLSSSLIFPLSSPIYFSIHRPRGLSLHCPNLRVTVG